MITSPYLRPPLSYTGGAVNRALLPCVATTEISVDLRTGTRHLHRSSAVAHPATPPVRPLVVRRLEPMAVCPVCRQEFQSADAKNPGRPRVYCRPACRAAGDNILRSARLAKDVPARRPIDVRAESAIAVAAVCAVFRVGRAAILMPTRGNKYATTPRLMAYALVKELHPEASTNDIGRAFDRDHSSILSGIQAHKRRMARGSYALRWADALSIATPAYQQAEHAA